MSCLARHPEFHLPCESTQPNHRYCAAYDIAVLSLVHWENPDYSASKMVKEARGKETMKAIADRTARRATVQD